MARQTMVYTGTVRSGVVVFENGSGPPDGARVRVEPIESPPRHPPRPEPQCEPRTALGAKIRDVRREVLERAEPLLDWEAIAREVRDRRGEKE